MHRPHLTGTDAADRGQRTTSARRCPRLFAPPPATLRAVYFPALLGTVLAVLPATPALARKAYRAESYRTEVRIQPDGSLRIREEIRVRFAGGPFTFFYRGLPTRRTEGIAEIVSPDSIEIRPRRSRIEVTWRFPATRDTVRTFELEYLARSAMLLGTRSDRLEWRLFPEERAYAIDHAVGAVVLPPGWPEPQGLATRPRGRDFHVARPHAQASGLIGPADPRSVVLSLGPFALEQNRSVVVLADVQAGFIEAPPSAWQERERLWRDRLPGVLIVSSFLLTLGVFWALWSRAYFVSQLQRGPGWSSPAGKVFALTAPPDDASPAHVGALTYGLVNAVPILAGLFDLARRGVIRFEVGPKRFAWSTPPMRIHPGPRPTGLVAWERVLLDAVFRKADGEGVATWDRAGSEIQKLGSRFLRATREELIQRGDLDARAIASRRRLYVRGLAIFGLAGVLVVLAFLLMPRLGPYAFIPAGAAVVAGSVAMVAGGTILPHTAQGAQKARAWRGFAKFLRESSKGNAALDTARFHAWLPHAVALGVAPAWIKAGKRWGLSVPDWFRTPSGNPGDISALLAVTAASSSHGGAGGGGGGAGGGGSSGAG